MLTAVYNIKQLKNLSGAQTATDGRLQAVTKAVNLDLFFTLSVAVLVVMFAVIFPDPWRACTTAGQKDM